MQKSIMEPVFNPDAIAVDRAVRDLSAGLPVRVGNRLVAAWNPAWLSQASSAFITAERLASLGFSITAPAGAVEAAANASWLALAADPFEPRAKTPLPQGAILPVVDDAPLRLLKHAALLPIALVLDDVCGDWLSVSPAAIAGYNAAQALALVRMSDAVVPLHDIGAVRVVAYRPKTGGLEHLAILTGKLAAEQAMLPAEDPIAVRLHSSCLTGDILGSMRCDCGEQLKKALEDSAKAGGGVVLYLNQEGRGIGLVNKLTAYRLQDAGCDTYEANQRLGYRDDERDYSQAATMLKDLGIQCITLMTNNPTKINAMKAHGITVTSRTAHSVPPNDTNRAYLAAKKHKAGHLL